MNTRGIETTTTTTTGASINRGEVKFSAEIWRNQENRNPEEEK